MHPLFGAPSRRKHCEQVILRFPSVTRARGYPSQPPELWCGCEPRQSWGHQKMVKISGVGRRRRTGARASKKKGG